MYKEKAIFHLPGYFKFPNIYEFILQNYKEHPESFRDNVEIGSVYDSPGCIWNSGRLMYMPETKYSLEYYRDNLNEYKIPMRLTFTNSLLKEEHTLDTYGNLILEIFDTGKNEILCNSPVLEQYIRQHYGENYKYISSTTKRLIQKEQQIAELNKYNLIILDYDYNKDFDFLKQIPTPEKCELLCNSVCKPNCNFREEHYNNISDCQLNYKYDELEGCRHGMVDNLIFARSNSNFISVEDINDIYLPMGFKHFKLEGRTASPLDLIEILLYYLIKEEFQDHARSVLHTLLWSIVAPPFPTKY